MAGSATESPMPVGREAEPVSTLEQDNLCSKAYKSSKILEGIKRNCTRKERSNTTFLTQPNQTPLFYLKRMAFGALERNEAQEETNPCSDALFDSFRKESDHQCAHASDTQEDENASCNEDCGEGGLVW